MKCLLLHTHLHLFHYVHSVTHMQ